MTKAQEQDVVDLLLEQHQQIRIMLAQLELAAKGEKQELFERLVRLLAVHETAEEEVVHPTARDTISHGEDVIKARLAEEDEAKRALAELYDLGVDNPQFDIRMAAVADAILDHADREEREEFTHLRDTLDPDRLRRMAGAVRAAEAVAPTRPHPGAGESATANLLAGPPMAVFDRVRDAVRDARRKSAD